MRYEGQARMNPKIRMTALAAALLVGGGLAYHFFFGTEAVIKRTIRRTGHAFEERRLPELMSVIARSYIDDQGSTYEDIQSGASEAFAQFESFTVTLEKLEVAVHGDRAHCTFLATVVTTTRDREKYMALGTPESGQPMELDLVKEGKTWHIIRAQGYTR